MGLACSLAEETGNEAISAFGRADHRHVEGAPGGVVAAELSRLGFIVSPTSRSARGADLLVTDQACKKAWSVQVKTNRRPANFWLAGPHASQMKSDSHVYVFVNIRGDARPEYLVVLSAHVADKVVSSPGKKPEQTWYSFYRRDRLYEGEGWEALFGRP